MLLGCIRFFLFFVLFFWLKAYATDPYRAQVFVDQFSTTFGASTPLNLIQDLRTASIQNSIPIYTSNSAASFNLNYRGLLGLSSFAANSTTLTVEFPQAGLIQTFTGSTRDESLQLFDQFLNSNRDGTRKLRRAYAKLTAIDPIAGNPNSLMGLMAQSDYALGRLTPLSGCDSCWTAQPIAHLFQAGLTTGRAFAQGFDTTIVSLPLRYSYSPCYDWAFIVDAPQMILVNARAVSFDASLGFGLRIPITSFWSLTPIARGGLGFSGDFYTGGIFVSSGIISTLDYRVKNYVLTMTNYGAYFSSTPFHAGGVNYDYHLYNFIFKNGLTLTSCKGFCIRNRQINLNVFFTDSDFTGRNLYIHHYDEIGFNFLTSPINSYLDYDVLSCGFSYQFGVHDYKGYYLNFVYQF